MKSLVAAIALLSFALTPKAEVSACSLEEPCPVPLSEVRLAPADFDGVPIKLEGFMRRVGNDLVLLPNEDSPLSHDGQGLLQVTNEPDSVVLMHGDKDVAEPVTVIGRFRADSTDRLPHAFGQMEEVTIVSVMGSPTTPASAN